jgi:hypothetical protein
MRLVGPAGYCPLPLQLLLLLLLGYRQVVLLAVLAPLLCLLLLHSP